MASANVQSIINTLRENPDLLIDLNKALTIIFAASGVTLTVDEKKEFYGEKGRETTIIHIHVNK